jgi:hypothetical protein
MRSDLERLVASQLPQRNISWRSLRHRNVVLTARLSSRSNPTVRVQSLQRGRTGAEWPPGLFWMAVAGLTITSYCCSISSRLIAPERRGHHYKSSCSPCTFALPSRQCAQTAIEFERINVLAINWVTLGLAEGFDNHILDKVFIIQ